MCKMQKQTNYVATILNKSKNKSQYNENTISAK